ncbi:MAG TPA: hypothetical protein VK889_09960 [Solirubrobacterales bacterium]|nr:hypothetical protein [Solirubrobacterales bacterium]
MTWLFVLVVLFLPGWAIAALAFPPGTISPAERGVYAIALSISVAAVGGLVLQLAIGLDALSWALLLVAVTAICGGRAAQLGHLQWPSPPRLPRALPFVAASFALAGTIAALAIASAQDGVAESRARIHFTDFWIAPGKATASPGRDGIVVGLRNREGERSRYRLRLSRGGKTVAIRRATLPPGHRRVWNFSAPAGSARVVAVLRRDDGPPRRLHLPFEG